MNLGLINAVNKSGIYCAAKFSFWYYEKKKEEKKQNIQFFFSQHNYSGTHNFSSLSTKYQTNWGTLLLLAPAAVWNQDEFEFRSSHVAGGAVTWAHLLHKQGIMGQ